VIFSNKKHECKCSSFPDNYSFLFYKFCSLHQSGLKRFPKKLIANQYAHLVHGLRPDMKRHPAAGSGDAPKPCSSPPQQFPVLSHYPDPPLPGAHRSLSPPTPSGSPDTKAG